MNLGKALSIIFAAHRSEIEMHIDVDTFHAPSECHDVVTKGEVDRLRQARRHARSIARMPVRVLFKKARKLTSEKTMTRAAARISFPRNYY
jgi:hypothetical protein